MGKWTGIGIKYQKNEKKAYEGEYLQDRCHGIGIQYNEFGSHLYEGDWKLGTREGKGIQYNEAGKLFLGLIKF